MLIQSGRWSDIWRIDGEQNHYIARKILHFATSQQTQKEWDGLLASWNAKLPVPKPLHFFYCNTRNKFSIDLSYIPHREFSTEDIDTYTEFVAALANRLASIPVKSKFIKFGWEEYYADLQKALNSCIENLYFNREYKKTILCKAKAKLKNCAKEVFIHGDFGRHNMGITERGIILFDFQWSCLGPVGWDLGYFFGMHSPLSFDLNHLFNTRDYAVWISVISAAVKVGRRINRREKAEELISILNSWIEVAKQYGI